MDKTAFDFAYDRANAGAVAHGDLYLLVQGINELRAQVADLQKQLAEQPVKIVTVEVPAKE